MSNETATTGSDSITASVTAVAGSKGLIIGNGLISIIIGVLLLSYPKGVLVTITFFLGLWLLLAGLAQIIGGFTANLDGGSRAAL
ncbi:MAG TPA: hypothetical protein DCR52_00500, partial [Actinobacteria bacterium]|nr:hypothetical protein [Actinomycetota bacterium]